MKQLLIPVLIVALMAGFSCKKKNKSSESYTPDCSGATPKYSANVSGIIQANCASASCHGVGSTKGPGQLTAYASVKNSAAAIRASVVNGSMPKNSSMSAEQKNAIVCWIDAGANND